MKYRFGNWFPLLMAGFLGCATTPHSAVSTLAPSAFPVFVAQVQNPNDYTLFANGGWTGDWNVAYNKGWVKKFSNLPKGNYARAYVGAKLGQMKILPPFGRPPQFKAIPGEMWVALSPTASWEKNQKRVLVETADIPLVTNLEFAIEDAGESQWYWVEIPVKNLNLSGDNYVALWSPTPDVVAPSSAPILAAAWGGKEVDTWVISNIKGDIPNNPKMDTSNGLGYFQSSIALKLIPEGLPHLLKVRVISWQNGTPDHLRPVITASVEGESVERAWVECRISAKRGDVVRGGQWQRVGRPQWKAPYVFSVDQDNLPKGKVELRITAANVWEETASSDPLEVEVSPVHAKK